MRKVSAGFTLVEILVALFIFSILAVMMANGLHRLLRVQGEVNQQAERLRVLQLMVVHLTRDLSLAIDRPITLAHGQEALSFRGRPNEFQFTGLDGPAADVMQQRVEYHYSDHTLTRWVWPTLDQADDASASKRVLLTKVNEARFDYMDKHGKAHSAWPMPADVTQPLPRAVRMTLQLGNEGRFVQTIKLMSDAEVLHAG